VRRLGEADAQAYLAVQGLACNAADRLPGREEGMRQFLDEKTYRPGLGQLDLKKAAKRRSPAAAKSSKPTTRVRAKAKAKR